MIQTIELCGSSNVACCPDDDPILRGGELNVIDTYHCNIFMKSFFWMTFPSLRSFSLEGPLGRDELISTSLSWACMHS